MGYKDMETALLETIIQEPGYSRENVTQGDYRILGRGLKEAVVLQPGPTFRRDIVATPRRLQVIWIVVIEQFLSFRGEISLLADDIRVRRQALIDHLDQYPNLRGTTNCVNAFIREVLEPDVIVADPVRWWRQEIRMYIEERTSITIVET